MDENKFVSKKDYQNTNVYVKPDTTIGRFQLIYIDKNTSEVIKSGDKNKGSGVQGGLIKESEKWGKNWKNDKM